MFILDVLIIDGGSQGLSGSFQLLDGESRRKRLLQFLGLLAVLNDQSVEITTASHLELGVGPVLLDLNRLCVFPSRRQQKIFNFLNLFRHCRSLVLTVLSISLTFLIFKQVKNNIKLPPC